MESNIKQEIIKFVGNKMVQYKEIMAHCVAQGYTTGQVAGALYVLHLAGKLDKPKRGFYQNPKGISVRTDFKNEINEVINNYLWAPELDTVRSNILRVLERENL